MGRTGLCRGRGHGGLQREDLQRSGSEGGLLLDPRLGQRRGAAVGTCYPQDGAGRRRSSACRDNIWIDGRRWFAFGACSGILRIAAHRCPRICPMGGSRLPIRGTVFWALSLTRCAPGGTYRSLLWRAKRVGIDLFLLTSGLLPEEPEFAADLLAEFVDLAHCRASRV